MARGSALAVAAAALMLAAAGCKPSSLTPFGVGERDYSTSGFNGVWQGSTSAGGTVFFQVADNKIVSLESFPLGPNACEKSFPLAEPIPIEDGTVTIDLRDGNDRLVVAGSFSSPTECAGTYRYEIHSTVGGCTGSGSGSFVATKAP
jgi:hypothetical protein